MAYNAISGTLIAAQKYVPGDLIVGNIISGNLSTSDGSSIINVPRVSNATNNSLLTNVGGNANTLTCESNLTFDGATLNITGDLTASIGVSASFFYGNGKYLTNVAGGGGSGDGIFTKVNAAAAYTTSSVQIGSNATPLYPLSVGGSSFLSGGVIHKRHATTANYSVTILDYYVGVDTTSNIVKLTLPAASSTKSGQTFVFKDEGGNAPSNNITISGSGADTIDGENFIYLASPYAAVSLYCNGIDKYFIC
jgi:hypothetical protein